MNSVDSFNSNTITARLRSARKLLVITGAGVSAESGVPTFRGAGGYWRNHRAEDLASPEGFARDPRLVWEWYTDRRRTLLDVQPNAGHAAIARLERHVPEFLLATQNVDGLHHVAGSTKVETVHGDIWTARCLRCGAEKREPHQVHDTLPPECSSCGGMLRPAVVWFGEMLPEAPLSRIQTFLHSPPGVDLALVIGTTALFGYIHSWALAAQRQGALLVEINPEETPLSAAADVCLRGPSGTVLPELLASAGVP